MTSLWPLDRVETECDHNAVAWEARRSDHRVPLHQVWSPDLFRHERPT